MKIQKQKKMVGTLFGSRDRESSRKTCEQARHDPAGLTIMRARTNCVSMTCLVMNSGAATCEHLQMQICM